MMVGLVKPQPEQAPNTGDLRERIIGALSEIYDPEIPVNIYDLGLIYKLDIKDDGQVRVVMTLTTPNCPVAESMPGQVREKVEAVDGVTKAEIDLVWEPRWDKDMMSESAKLALDMW